MLYNIVRNRNAVNALKLLSKENKIWSLKESGLSESSANLLLAHGLIQFEKGAKKSVTISLKGKQFIKLMDELKILVEKEDKRKGIKLSFSLSKPERQMLLLISKLGFTVVKTELFEQLKEQKSVTTKKSMDKLLKSLEEIRLIKLEKEVVKITELGKQTIINELLEEFNLI